MRLGKRCCCGILLLIIALIVVASCVVPSADAKRRLRRTVAKTNASSYRRLASAPLFTPLTAEEHRVEGLPGLTANISSFAGLVPVTSANNTIFYWFFESMSNPSKDPVLIWLNGGPGCSSMDGIFIENGPLRVQPNGTVLINEFSWTAQANVLYVDQPAGTGLSYNVDGNYPTNQDQINEQFYKFLSTWYTQLFPQYQSNDLYISGESYAGHYIPAFAYYILQQNQNQANPLKLNLKGIAIGNGWTDPYHQYAAYPEFAFSVGLIGLEQKLALDQQFAVCQQRILSDGNNVSTYNFCEDINDNLLGNTGTNTTDYVNVYDVRIYDSDGGATWPKHLETLTHNYLNTPEVREALNLPPLNQPPLYLHNYTMCNDDVYNAITDQAVSVTPQLISALSQIRVLLYSGQFDYTCNHMGTERFIHQMTNWTGLDGYKTAPRNIWIVDDHVAGYARTYQNLTFLLILGGSHMVPMDKPAQTQNMINRFMNDQSFADVPQTLAMSNDKPVTPVVSGGLAVWKWVLICVSSFVLGTLVATGVTVLVAKNYFRVQYARIN